MIGNIEIKARPLRMAYLVDPNNANQVREAIRLSCTLWGGAYFPIIPLYKRLPDNWKTMHLGRDKPEAVSLGYIEAFDPDLLVGIATDVSETITGSGLPVVSAADLWRDIGTGRVTCPSYGIGIFELFDDIFQQHFRYKEKYPLKIICPTLPKSLTLFWSSVFGEFCPSLAPALISHFRDALDIEEVNFTIDRLADLMKPNVLFPRRTTEYGLTRMSRSGWGRHEARVFYLDATKVSDIIDFWNLRALGHSVIPLPKQLKHDKNIQSWLLDFLKASRLPWPHEPKVHDFAAIIRSRHCSFEEMQEFANTIRADPSIDPSTINSLFSLQHWYPRIWDEWGRDKDAAIPCDFYAEDEYSEDLPDTRDIRITVKSVLPAFASEYAFHGNPKCANEVSFHLYGTDQYFAEVFPKSTGKHVLKALGGLISWRKEWRVSRGRLVRLVNRNHGERRTIPLAESIMLAWLRDLGWKPTLSPPGILAKQIYSQLEGQLFPLHHESFLGLLEYMNGGKVRKDNSPTGQNATTAELERDLPIGEVKSRLSNERGNLYEYLLSKGVFRLGSRIPCPHCLRKSWFTLANITEALTCPKCLRAFPAIGNVTNGHWSYKTTGPFSVPAYAEGAYTVLLAIEFFSDNKLGTLRTTPIVSFTAEGSGKDKLEADCAMLWEELIYGERREGVLFCECKTYGLFEKKDFERMKHLAASFPGAILVFSTLRKSITRREIQSITRIARSGRKYWKADRPINPVLILTGTELLDWQRPPGCWTGTQKEKFRHLNGLLELCNATQQIYLNLPSWGAEWQADWEKKRKQRVTKRSLRKASDSLAPANHLPSGVVQPPDDKRKTIRPDLRHGKIATD